MVEFSEVLRRRHMVRSFEAGPLDDGLVRGLFEPALRAPSASNTAGTAWVVLEGAERARYWELATTEEWQTRSRRFEGLSRAPVVALSLASPAAYVERYSEPDKAPSGLGDTGSGGGGPEAWPVPYWFGDAAFATMGVLLAATDAGLGAAFLGNFRHEHELLAAFGVPPHWRLFGTVLLGRPDGGDHRSASLDRERPAFDEVVRRQGW